MSLDQVVKRAASWRAQLERSDQACHQQVDHFMREAASEPVYGAEALQALWLVQELLGAGMVEEARELLQMRFPGTVSSRQPLEVRVGGTKRRPAARRAASGSPGAANDTVETLHKSRPRLKPLLRRIMAARARALNARHRAVDPSVVYSYRSSPAQSPSSAARDVERSDVQRWTSRAGGSAIPEWGTEPRTFATRATGAGKRASTREALSRMADARARAMADARAEVQARLSPNRALAAARAGERLASPPGQARAAPPQPQPQPQPQQAYARRAAHLASLLPSPFAAPAADAADKAASPAPRAVSKADVQRQVQNMLKQRMAQRFRAAASTGRESGSDSEGVGVGGGGGGGERLAPAATPLPVATANPLLTATAPAPATAAAAAAGSGDVRASIRAQVEARLAARRR